MDAIKELYQQAMYREAVRRHRMEEQTAAMRLQRAERKEELMALLDEDGQNALRFYEDALNELEEVKHYEVFRIGVQMGASLMRELEVFAEDARG